ncbi:hypothetical protein YC2023_036186 [Brassica napus]
MDKAAGFHSWSGTIQQFSPVVDLDVHAGQYTYVFPVSYHPTDEYDDFFGM